MLFEVCKSSSKSVESPALALQSVRKVESCDCLVASMFSIGDCISDNVLEQNLDTRLLVHQACDALDSRTSGQSTNGWLGDSLNIISQNLPVPLESTFAWTNACVSL